MKKKIRCLAFLVLCGIMINRMSNVYQRKTTTGSWDYMNILWGFENEKENSIDIIAFGSSHMYCTLVPTKLYTEKKIRSYVLATPQQPLSVTAAYMEHALKTQSPQLLIVECYMAYTGEDATPEEAVLYDAIDPLPFSLTKLKIIRENVTKEEQKNFLFNIIKYHSRWNVLDENDYNTSYKHETHDTLGYVYLTQKTPLEPWTYHPENYADSRATLSPKTQNALEKMITLSKDSGTELLFLFAPYQSASSNQDEINGVKQLAKKHNINCLDMNLYINEMDLDYSTDFFDLGHLNFNGAKKATNFLYDYVMESYDLNF